MVPLREWASRIGETPTSYLKSSLGDSYQSSPQRFPLSASSELLSELPQSFLGAPSELPFGALLGAPLRVPLGRPRIIKMS